jgi:aminoglycoside 6'-N-acetyltransferase
MPDESAYSIAIHDLGPAWVPGGTSRDQPFWPQHADFIDGLVAAGRILLAGPFADRTGALLLFAADPPTVERLLAEDPFVVNGIFLPAVVRPWVCWVDPLATGLRNPAPPPPLDAAPSWRLILRRLKASDEPELLRIHRTPEVMRWWGPPDDMFPWDDLEATRLTIVVDGAIAGLIQYSEETEPKYRHASIDLFLDPAYHGRGIGTEAVSRVARMLVEEHGHHRVTIDPAAANEPAIRAYEKAGFRPVGIMRRYEHDATGDGWHDGLLMELIARPEPA